MMDLFCLLKESFKNLLFDPLITGRSFDKLPYLSSCLLSQNGDSKEYARTYYEALNQTLLTQKDGGSSLNTLMFWKLIVPSKQ